MRLFFICLLIGFATGTLAKAERAMLTGPVPATVQRVIDGDTLLVTAQIWLGQSINVRVRLADVDAPELFRPACPQERRAAEDARDFVQDWAARGDVVLSDIHYGKYAGRVVADVTRADGADLAEALRQENLAKASTSRRSAFC